MKALLALSFLISFTALGEIKKRYELNLNQTLSPAESYQTTIQIQNGQVSTNKDLIFSDEVYCSINISLADKISGGPFYLMTPITYRNGHLFKAYFVNDNYMSQVRGVDCQLKSDEDPVAQVNEILGPTGSITLSKAILKQDLDDEELVSACEEKVISHYKGIYHRTYKAASNTFLNNFIGRKNLFAHTFGVPKVAFLRLMLFGENPIADRIVEKSKRSGDEVYETYMRLLRTEELCQDLKDQYKKPRKVRRYLLEKLKQS